MATMRKKSGASKGKGKGKSGTVLKDLATKRVAGEVKGGLTIGGIAGETQDIRHKDATDPWW